MRSTPRSGFSLVELAIVLAILGLLAGGIIAGSSMVRNSQLKAVLKEYGDYKSATDQFMMRFKALPGDMTNATQYWGADASCPNTPTNTVPKIPTCDGNGDQHIATMVSPYSDFTELYRAWQQLSNAELVPGIYTGVAGSASFQHSVIGQNVPASRFPNAGWSFYPLEGSQVVNSASYFDVNGYKEVFLFGAPSTTFGTGLPILSGPEARDIDRKIDDGRPGYGIVSTFKDTPYGYDCVSTDVQSTAQYNVGDDTVRCALIFQVESATQ